ncbi:hypothetical protein L596_019210 [Steinernema carpocapsae]|uniref:Uncharacterized protein n=1 Tax=Steinernema carpocapsae TaxID=34508 RepID=A0A4U5MPS6_STECR|nr:hypothetical protein L596_019210 [Steinernema carpocapsae]
MNTAINKKLPFRSPSETHKIPWTGMTTGYSSFIVSLPRCCYHQGGDFKSRRGNGERRRSGDGRGSDCSEAASTCDKPFSLLSLRVYEVADKKKRGAELWLGKTSIYGLELINKEYSEIKTAKAKVPKLQIRLKAVFVKCEQGKALLEKFRAKAKCPFMAH